MERDVAKGRNIPLIPPSNMEDFTARSSNEAVPEELKNFDFTSSKDLDILGLLRLAGQKYSQTVLDNTLLYVYSMLKEETSRTDKYIHTYQFFSFMGKRYANLASNGTFDVFLQRILDYARSTVKEPERIEDDHYDLFCEGKSQLFVDNDTFLYQCGKIYENLNMNPVDIRAGTSQERRVQDLLGDPEWDAHLFLSEMGSFLLRFERLPDKSLFIRNLRESGFNPLWFVDINPEFKDYLPYFDVTTNSDEQSEPVSLEPTSSKTLFSSTMDKIDYLLDKPMEVIASATGLHLKRILTYIMYWGLFPENVAVQAQFFTVVDTDELSRLTEKGSTFESIIAILKSVSFLIRQTIDGSENFTDSTDPLTFVHQVNHLYCMQHNRTPDATKDKFKDCMPESQYKAGVLKLFKNRTRVAAHVHGMPSMRRLVAKAIEDITLLHTELSYTSPGERLAPINIALVGDSQCGKTQFLAPSISYIMQKVMGIPVKNLHDNFKMVNMNDQYLSSYNGNTDVIVGMEENGGYKIIDKVQNPLTTGFLEMLSGGSFVLNSAALHEKGKRCFQPLGIVLLGNDVTLGFSSFLNYPEAAYNRINALFEVRIKERFQRKDENGHPIGGVDNCLVEHTRSELRKTMTKEEAQLHDDWYPFHFKEHRKTYSGFVEPKEPTFFQYTEFCRRVQTTTEKHVQRLAGDIENKKTVPPMFSTDIVEGNSETRPVQMEPTSALNDPISVHYSMFDLFQGLFYIIWYKLVWITVHLSPRKFQVKILDYYTNGFVRTQLDKRARNIIEKAKLSRKEYTQQIENLFKERLIERAEKYKPILGILLFLTAGCIFLAKQVSSSKTKPKSDPFTNDSDEEEEDIGMRPAGNKIPFQKYGSKPSKTPFYNNPYPSPKVNSVILGRSSNTPLSVLENKAINNLYILSMFDKNDEMIGSVNGTIIKGSFFLLPDHVGKFFSTPGNKLEISKPLYKDEGGHVQTYNSVVATAQASYLNYARIGKDLCLLFLPMVHAGLDLTKFLIRDYGDLRCCEGSNPHFRRDNSLVRDSFQGNKKYFTYETENKSISVHGLIGKTYTTSFPGRCGSLVLGKIGKNVAIMGSVVAGKLGDYYSGAEMFNLHDINDAIDRMRSCIMQPTSTCEVAESFSLSDTKLSEVTYKDYVHWLSLEEMGGINTIGSDRTIKTHRPTSKVYNLPSSKLFFQYFPPEYHHTLIAPNFKDYHTSEGEFKSMWKKMLTQVSHQAHNVDMVHLDAIIDHIYNKWSKVKEFDDIEIWDIDSATSGCSYNSYCKAMPKKTSAGFRFPGKKIDYLIPMPSDMAPDGYVPNEKLRKIVFDGIDNYALGNRNDVVYTCCPKDEPRDSAKVTERKIRIFTISPVDQVITQRMYCGSFMGIFMNNFQECETVGGVNCYGKEWGDIYLRLKKHRNVINGDYSTYDKLVSSVVILAASTIIKRLILRSVGYSEELDNILTGIFSDVAHPNLCILQNFIRLNGSLSSGISLTFVLNNIENSIYIRLAWLNIYCKNVWDKSVLTSALSRFDENVEFAALGDDNTFSVSDESITDFNFRSIRDYFKGIGMKYTLADKSDNEYGSVPIEFASIGKRKWAWCPILKHYKCPIEKASIGKMITIAMHGGPLTTEQKYRASLVSAFYEFAQYSMIEYDECITRLKIINSELGIEMLYPTYHTMWGKILDDESNPWTFEDMYDTPVSLDPYELDDYTKRLVQTRDSTESVLSCDE